MAGLTRCVIPRVSFPQNSSGGNEGGLIDGGRSAWSASDGQNDTGSVLESPSLPRSAQGLLDELSVMTFWTFLREFSPPSSHACRQPCIPGGQATALA